MEPAAIQVACWRNSDQPGTCDTWIEWQRRAQQDWGIKPDQFNSDDTGYPISTPQERYLEFAARFSAPQGAEKYKALNLCLIRAVRAGNIEDARYFLELEADDYSGAIYEATRKGHSELVRIIQEYMENEETIRSSSAEGYGERGILPRGPAPPTELPTLPTATLSLPGSVMTAPLLQMSDSGPWTNDPTLQSTPNVSVLVGAARGSQLKLFTYLLTTITIGEPQVVLLAALVGWSEAELEQPLTLPTELRALPEASSSNTELQEQSRTSPVEVSQFQTSSDQSKGSLEQPQTLPTSQSEVENHLAIGRFLLNSLSSQSDEEEAINWEPIAYNLGLHHNEVGLRLLLTKQSSRLRLEYFWGQVAANDVNRLNTLLEQWSDAPSWIDVDPGRWSYEIGKGGVWDLVPDQRIDWDELLKGAAMGGHTDLIMMARERAVILAETIFDAIDNADQSGYDDISDALSGLVPEMDEP